MSNLFNTGHVAKLDEIQSARLRRGMSGIGLEIEELIRRLESGGVAGKSNDVRETQAKRLWDLGYGKWLMENRPALGITSFETYLATIPAVPAGLVEHDDFLPLLTLDDPRVPRTVRARLAGVKHAEFGYADDTLAPFDARHETGNQPYWFRAHDGRVNNGKKPSECRALCTGNLLAGTADVLIALFTQHTNVVKEGEHIMDGPGSVHRETRTDCAYLGVWDGSPELVGHHGGDADSFYGTVVFRRE